MRIRPMRAGDFPGVKAVYEARRVLSVGLVIRGPDRWNMLRRMRKPKTFWIVAEEKGNIIGYAIGLANKGYRDTGEVMWLPEYDGTDLEPRLLDVMLKHLEKNEPDSIMIWGIEGSPTLLLPMPPDFERTEATGVFMAGVTDVRLLLKDAKEILGTRVKGRIRLNVEGKTAIIGREGPEIKVGMEKGVLLGLLLGIRNLDEEIKKGNVKFAPKNMRSLHELRLAFPAKKFRIEDAW